MADPYNQGIRTSLEDSRSPYRVNHNVLKTTLANSTANPPRPSPTNNYNPYATHQPTPPTNYPPPQQTGLQPQQHQSQPHTAQSTPSSYQPTTTSPPTGYPPQTTPSYGGYPPNSASPHYTPPSTNTPTYSPQTTTPPTYAPSTPSGYPPTSTPSGYPPSGYSTSEPQHGAVQHSQSQPLPQSYNQPAPYSGGPQHAASMPAPHSLPQFTPSSQVPSAYPPSQQPSQPVYPPTQPTSQSSYPPTQQPSQGSYPPTQQSSQSAYPPTQPTSQPAYQPTQPPNQSAYPPTQQASQSAYPPQYPPTHQQSHPSLHPQPQSIPQQPLAHSSQHQLQQPQAYTPQQTPSQSYPGSQQQTPQQFPSQPSLHAQPSPYAQPTPSQVSPYPASLPPPQSQSQPQSQSHTPHVVSQPNSQQQLALPVPHSASQPALEPRSAPLSSLGHGSGHTSSEDDFQLRKNFSVIGGIKKAKSQHVPMQMVQIDPANITREYPHLARGSFGIVYKGRMVGRNEKIVIKDLEIQNQKSIDDWKKELDVMSQCLSNPYAAQVYGYSSSGNILSIIMEFFPKGDLYKVLHTEKDKHPLSLLQRMRMARHTALAISNMHEVGLMHRDIKSMNILVTEDYECKLTDFGCTKLVNDRQIHNTANTGTPLWMAPEVLKGNYNFSADVYSIGLVLFEIFERKLPEFEPSVGVKLPTRFMSASVVLPCLSRDPTQRPTASDVVKIVDKLLKSMLDSMKDLLQPAELAVVSSYITSIEASQEHDLSDFLDVNLLALYNYLLTKSPKEMDKLIETAYAIDLSEDLGPFVPVNPPVVNSGPIPSYSPYVPPTHVQPYAAIPSYPQYGAPQAQYGAQQPYGYPQPQPYMMPQQVRPQPSYGPTMY